MDDQLLSEPPTASAAALAQQRGLGEWTGRTYATNQGWRYRKWQGWRLYVYVGGVIVTAPDGYEAAYDWGTTRVLQYRRSVNGALRDARYTLIDPSGNAVNIGPGMRGMLNKEKQRLGITSMVNGAPFSYPGDWGDPIERGITRAQLPGVVERIQRGGTVEFGPYKADRNGLASKKRTATWAEIDQIRVYDGMARFWASDNRTLVDSQFTHDIPNVNLFLNLCHYLKG
ncbi:DUF6585 family protein [Streptomyces luteireticuli]|uniref:DUF6585 family protein n=1 Tax=Streptomyces luteireticuli TaxID=173858 RepID=UPI0035587CD0